MTVVRSILLCSINLPPPERGEEVWEGFPWLNKWLLLLAHVTTNSSGCSDLEVVISRTRHRGSFPRSSLDLRFVSSHPPHSYSHPHSQPNLITTHHVSSLIVIHVSRIVPLEVPWCSRSQGSRLSRLPAFRTLYGRQRRDPFHV